MTGEVYRDTRSGDVNPNVETVRRRNRELMRSALEWKNQRQAMDSVRKHGLQVGGIRGKPFSDAISHGYRTLEQVTAAGAPVPCDYLIRGSDGREAA